MAKLKGKKLARETYELFDHFRSQRRSWENEVAKDNAYYLGNQWTEAEKTDLQIRGKAPLVFNIIRGHVDGKKGIMAANAPRFKCFPRGDEDTGISTVMDKVLDYIWYISNGRMQLLQAAHEYCVGGLGWMQTDIDPFADDNNGEVVVRYLPWPYVYVDPTAHRRDFSDARRIFVSMRVPRETARMMYPDKKVQIARAEADGDSDWAGVSMTSESGIITPADYDYTDANTQDYVRIIERYELVYELMYKVYDSDAIHPVYMLKEDFQNYELTTDQEADEVLLKRCRRVITIGQSIVIADEILPIDDFPLVPFVNVHTHTPYPHGDVRDLRDPQDEKNKRRMVIIHHAMAAGTNRVLAAEGTVDPELWERKLSVPGAVLTYTGLPGVQPPQPFPTEQLPNAFFAMEEKSERDIEAITGVYPSMLGDPTNSPDTYRATLMMEEAGTRRIRGNDMAVFEHGLSRLGSVTLQLAQNHYSFDKTIRIIGEGSEVTKFVVNKVESDDVGRVKRVINDISIGRFDVICTAGSTMPTNRMAEEEKYKEYFSIGLVDREGALRKMDVADPDAILARFGELAQLQGALEQQGEDSKKLQGIIQTLQRQLIQQDIKMTEKEYELLKQAELLAVQAQTKVAKVLMTARADTFSKELSGTRDLIERETRTKANAALEVLKAKKKEGPAN